MKFLIALLSVVMFLGSAVAQTECPQSQFTTLYWLTTPDSVTHQQAGIDLGTTNDLYLPAKNWFSGPTDVPGVFTICRTLFLRDTQATAQGGKNAFVSINHMFGVGTSGTNQDRALWVSAQNPLNDTAERYGFEGVQVQLDINGTPNFTGAPDGEASAFSVQLADHHIGTIPGPTNFGINGFRMTYTRASGAGSWGSNGGAGARIRTTNFSRVPGIGTALYGMLININDLAAPFSSNIGGIALEVGSPIHDYAGTRFPSYNMGVHITDYGKVVGDYNLYSQSQCTECGVNLFQGPVWVQQEIRTNKPTNTDVAGVGVLPFSYTFTSTNLSAPVCVASDTTALNPVLVQVTKTGFTVTGTDNDSVNYICIGRN